MNDRESSKPRGGGLSNGGETGQFSFRDPKALQGMPLQLVALDGCVDLEYLSIPSTAKAMTAIRVDSRDSRANSLGAAREWTRMEETVKAGGQMSIFAFSCSRFGQCNDSSSPEARPECIIPPCTRSR